MMLAKSKLSSPATLAVIVHALLFFFAPAAKAAPEIQYWGTDVGCSGYELYDSISGMRTAEECWNACHEEYLWVVATSYYDWKCDCYDSCPCIEETTRGSPMIYGIPSEKPPYCNGATNPPTQTALPPNSSIVSPTNTTNRFLKGTTPPTLSSAVDFPTFSVDFQTFSGDQDEIITFSPGEYYFFAFFSFIRNVLILITILSSGYFVYLCLRFEDEPEPQNISQSLPTSQDNTENLRTVSQNLELRRRALPLVLTCNIFSESFLNNMRDETKEGKSKVEQNFSSYFKRISDDEINEEGFECLICLESLEYGQEISTSETENCSHVFHKDCVLEWLLKSDVCPCCRTQMVDPIKIKRVMETVNDGTNV